MNEFSSRSHLIVTLTVNVADGRDESLTSSKLNLVDLAGSERVKQSEVESTVRDSKRPVPSTSHCLGRVGRSRRQAAERPDEADRIPR